MPRQLQPNLNSKTTNKMNLDVLRRKDPEIADILFNSGQVVVYDLDTAEMKWSRKNVEGSLFVVQRRTQPHFQLFILNQLSTENYVQDLPGPGVADFDLEVAEPYIFVRTAGAPGVDGYWFYEMKDLHEVADLVKRIRELAYSRLEGETPPVTEQVPPAPPAAPAPPPAPQSIDVAALLGGPAAAPPPAPPSAPPSGPQSIDLAALLGGPPAAAPPSSAPPPAQPHAPPIDIMAALSRTEANRADSAQGVAGVAAPSALHTLLPGLAPPAAAAAAAPLARTASAPGASQAPGGAGILANPLLPPAPPEPAEFSARPPPASAPKSNVLTPQMLLNPAGAAQTTPPSHGPGPSHDARVLELRAAVKAGLLALIQDDAFIDTITTTLAKHLTT